MFLQPKKRFKETQLVFNGGSTQVFTVPNPLKDFLPFDATIEIYTGSGNGAQAIVDGHPVAGGGGGGAAYLKASIKLQPNQKIEFIDASSKTVSITIHPTNSGSQPWSFQVDTSRTNVFVGKALFITATTGAVAVQNTGGAGGTITTDVPTSVGFINKLTNIIYVAGGRGYDQIDGGYGGDSINGAGYPPDSVQGGGGSGASVPSQTPLGSNWRIIIKYKELI